MSTNPSERGQARVNKLLGHLTPGLVNGDASTLPHYDNVIIEVHGRVGLIYLNRPKQFNALNDKLVDDLCLGTYI